MKQKMKVVPPKKGDQSYVRLWKQVDAAVLEALSNHPEYVRQDLIPYVRLSINKRVTGRILGELRCNAKSFT